MWTLNLSISGLVGPSATPAAWLPRYPVARILDRRQGHRMLPVFVSTTTLQPGALGGYLTQAAQRLHQKSSMFILPRPN